MHHKKNFKRCLSKEFKMSYNWSISTTLRNPNRMIEWLRVAQEYLIGCEWDNAKQIEYQILLIQHKLYTPTNITEAEKEKFDTFTELITFNEAKTMFLRQNYQDPAMRGRTSFSPLKKFGLLKLDSNNIIRMTSLGEYLLSDSYDFGYFLFRVFLKWEYKNPSENKTNTNFNINPFIATLHLINQVNLVALENNDVVKGVSKDEFMLFVQTLTNYENISFYARELYSYRNFVKATDRDASLSHQQKEDIKRSKKLAILGLITHETNNERLERLLKNLKDYTDNTIRYFRATRYLHIRGGGYYIDLEPRRRVEIDVLLDTYDGSSSMFENEDDYIEYLADINLPVLPWETTQELHNILDTLAEELTELEAKLSLTPTNFNALKVDDIEELKSNTQMLRDKRKHYLDIIMHNELQDISKIQECIYSLEHIRELENKPSIELERWTTMALNALNDALSINPNYPVGDDNEPLFTAPAGKADIECFYSEFNSICEVTMLVGRDQWYNEGQPVMRHLREFEDRYRDNFVYCLFVAPRLHQDTVNTFWTSTKYEYEGEKQRIIPLTITQLVELLKILIELKQNGKRLLHNDMKNLFDTIVGATNSVANSRDWIANIPSVMKSWKAELLS